MEKVIMLITVVGVLVIIGMTIYLMLKPDKVVVKVDDYHKPDGWLSIEETDFSNFDVIRIDTRDFHCIQMTDKKKIMNVKDGTHKIPLEKYSEYSCKDIAEVKQWLLEFRNTCGGVADWRMLSFEVDHCYNWSLKYLNIVNYDGKVIITNKDNRSIKWGDLIERKLIKEHLNAHNK